MWQLPKAPTHSGETALTAEQQRTADYLEQTGSTAKGRTVVKDGTGTHWTEERVGAKVGKAPVAKPEQQAQPAPETGEFAPASVDAKYSQAIIEIGNNWDLEINNMQVGGELTKGQLLDELHRYLNNAALTHTELNVTEAGGDFNTMVDNMDARLRAHLSPELDFVLNHHPQGDSPLVLAPDGEDSNVIKFMHNGKEYVLQDPDRVFKMVDGKLFVAEEYGDFSPATCGVDEDDNPVVEPTEDAIKMAASQ
jgi:hypothetical protein